MKVIKPGASEWKRTTKCKECDCEMEFTPDDVVMGDFGCGYGDDHDYKTYVPCPECKSVVLGGVPQWIADTAEAKRREKR